MILIDHFSTLRGAGHKLHTHLARATTALRELWQSTPWRLGWRAVAIGITGYWMPRAATLTEPLLQVTANILTVLTGLLLVGSLPATLLRMLLSFGVRKQPSAAARSFDTIIACFGLYWLLDIILLYFTGTVLLQAVGPAVLQAAHEYPEKMAAAALASGIFILLVLSAVMMLLFRRQATLRIRLEEMVPDDDPVAAPQTAENGTPGYPYCTAPLRAAADSRLPGRPGLVLRGVSPGAGPDRYPYVQAGGLGLP